MTAQSSINPATGELLESYPEHAPSDVEQKIARAHACYLEWKNVPIEKRGDSLRRVAAVLRKNKDAYATLIAQEMGKPFKEGIAEIEKCAATAVYFADNAPKFLADQVTATEYKKSYVAFRPIGIVLGIMPWNFPFWQVLRFALPSLVAGNVGLLKHASNVPGCALAIESAFKEAGLPEGCFQSLLIDSRHVEPVIADRRVAAVTLTGSTPAGKAVASAAGRHLKKVVLELGGSDPYLILKDADLALAIRTCGASRLTNCGQSCVSAKRLIVVPAMKEKFEQGLAELFSKQIIGDPLDPKTTMGPMARADLRDALHKQVEKSVTGGAKLLAGGKNPGDKSAFYPPTIITDVRKGVAAYEEELFGPVAVIIPAKDEEDAIRIANDTEFGLGGAVFTTDLARGEQIARERVESGLCFVNQMVRSDARFPFGGVKNSGYGRELSAFGIHEFVNVKTIIVA